MSKALQLPKRNIIGMQSKVAAAYSGMASGVKMNGVPVLVIAESFEALDQALINTPLDQNNCARFVATHEGHFDFDEEEI